jgi:Zn-dependent protease with chaperone function
VGPSSALYTLVLARSQEYSADRHSAEVVGATIAGDALTAVANIFSACQTTGLPCGRRCA